MHTERKINGYIENLCTFALKSFVQVDICTWASGLLLNTSMNKFTQVPDLANKFIGRSPLHFQVQLSSTYNVFRRFLQHCYIYFLHR
jgi:hypothetical protein